MVKIVNGEIVRDDDPRAANIRTNQAQQPSTPQQTVWTGGGHSSFTQQIAPGSERPTGAAPFAGFAGGGGGGGGATPWYQREQVLFGHPVKTMYILIGAAVLYFMAGPKGLFLAGLVWLVGASEWGRQLRTSLSGAIGHTGGGAVGTAAGSAPSTGSAAPRAPTGPGRTLGSS